MVKIRLIYDNPEEFRKVLKLLSPIVKFLQAVETSERTLSKGIHRDKKRCRIKH